MTKVGAEGDGSDEILAVLRESLLVIRVLLAIFKTDDEVLDLAATLWVLLESAKEQASPVSAEESDGPVERCDGCGRV